MRTTKHDVSIREGTVDEESTGRGLDGELEVGDNERRKSRWSRREEASHVVAEICLLLV